MATNQDITVKLTLDDKGYIKGIKGSTKETEKFGKKGKESLAGVEKQTGLTTKALSNMGSVIVGALGTAAISKTVTSMISMNKAMFDIGMGAEGISKAFKNIAGSDLQALRNATKGTVDDLTLMQNAVKGVNLGLDVKEMGSLFKFAQQRARETGESVDHLVESITVGIGRKSPLILDNLGISAIQLKEAMGGVSMETASVADVTRAVGKIAEESMTTAADMTDNMGSAVDRLNASWKNALLEGGEMLVQNEELKKVITDLVQVINTNKASILQFITDWGVGAAKIAKHLAEVAGFWAEVFTDGGKTDIQKQVEVVGELNDELNRQKEILKEIPKMYSGDVSKKIDRQKESIKKVNKEYLRQQMLLNNLVNLGKAESKLEEAKKWKTEQTTKKTIAGATTSKGTGASFTTFNGTADVDTNPLFKSLDPNAGLYGQLGTLGGVSQEELAIMEENWGKINQTVELAIDEQTKQSLEMDKEHNQRMLDEAKLQRIQMVQNVTGALNSVRDMIGIWANDSLNMFGKLAGSAGSIIGNFAPMIDAAIGVPGASAAIGAGVGLLGDIFGQADEDTSTTDFGSEIAKTQARQPSATISKSGPDTVNNFNDISFNSTYMDSEGFREMASNLMDEMRNIQLASI